MAAGFPAKGTGGTLFVNGNALPASDLNDLGGTLNLIAPSEAQENDAEILKLIDERVKEI